MDLSSKKCVPCEGGVPPLDEKQIKEYKKQISSGWKVIDNNKLTKEFFFVSYRQTIDFVNKVADIAETDVYGSLYQQRGRMVCFGRQYQNV